MKKKIAIVTTHPIQYYAPLFKLLAQQIDIKVFYTWGKDSLEKFDPGFGKKIEWDIPLLDGYEYTFLQNNSKNPGSHHFKGIDNPTIIKEIEEYAPSAILVFGWSYSSHLKVLRYFKGKTPIYFRGDSTLLDNTNSTLKDKFKLFFKKQFLRWIYSNVDKVFYVGSANKAYFEWARLDRKQLIFAPHAIDNNRFAQNYTFEVSEMKETLKIPETAIVILFAGKLEPKKNPFLLLKSFIEAKTDNLHLVFVGNGTEEKDLKELALSSSKKDYIHFADFQNQSLMPIWYNIADVFCLPSKGPGETWGLAVNEAMVCGKVIIISNKVGCAEDLIKVGVNGWVFESTKQPQLKQIIEKIPKKSTLKKMGAESRQIIENWKLEITAQNILKEWANK